MALTKVTGEFIDISDLDLSDVGTISLDAIQGDADANTSITFSGSDVITIATGGSGRLTIGDGALSPVTDNQIDLGTASLEFKDAFFDGTVTADAFAGPLTGNVTGNASGTALTVTQAAQSAITSVGTLTSLTLAGQVTGVTNLFVADDIGHTGDSDTYMSWNANNLTIYNGGVNNLYMTPTEVVFNDGGSSSTDFRIEGDTDANAFFVKASNNRVGIGTASPAVALDVNGTLSSNGNENVARIQAGEGVNAGGITIHSIYGNTAASRITSIFSIDNQDQASPLGFGNGTSTAMYIKEDGKVGIGTTSPNANLSLGAVIGAKRFLVYDGGSGNNLYAGFGIDSPASNDFSMYAHNSGVLKFGKMGTDASTITPYMTIDNAGKVGIGTTSPQGILHLDEGAGDDCTLICETHAGGDSMIRFTQGNSGPAWSVGLDAGSGTSDGLSFAYKSNGFPSLTGEGLMCITTTGQVGIGTTNPTTNLHIKVGSAGADPTGSQENIVLESNTNSYMVILAPAAASLIGYSFSPHNASSQGGMFYEPNNDKLKWRTNTQWNMVMDTDGNVGIGTEAPSQKLHIFQTEGNAGAKHASIQFSGYAAYKDRGPEIAAYRVDGNSNNQGLIFSTYDASNAVVETLRMTNAGKVGVNNTNPTHTLDVIGTGAFNNTLHMNSNAYLQWTGGTYMSLRGANSNNDMTWTTAPSGGGIRWYLSSGGRTGYDGNTTLTGHGNFVGEVAANMKAISFQRTNGGSEVGYIVTNASSTGYQTSSDYRLKENVNYAWDATTRLKQLKPARFNWIADETNTLLEGFLAHEVTPIVPEAVSGVKDAMTEPLLYTDAHEIPEGKSEGDVRVPSRIDPQGVDQSKLVPLLVKAVQELTARIEELENA